MVYHWKAIDSARLDEIDRLPKIFEKIRSDSPRLCAEGYRRCPLCRINRITEDFQRCQVRFSRRLSKITEDSLFAEPGGFPKVRQCSICRISPKIEVVRQRSIYLGGYPRCAKLSESHKSSDEQITNYTVSEFLSQCSVLQCVYAGFEGFKRHHKASIESGITWYKPDQKLEKLSF